MAKQALVRAKPPKLKALRARHHILAQYIAAGMRPAQASLLTGFKTSTIYQLQSQDPAFKELVEHYRQQKEAQFVDLARMMADLSVEAVEAIRDRLRESPEEFGPKDLMELLRTLADRTGFGPTKKEEKTLTLRGVAEKMAEVIDAEIVEDGATA